MIVTGKTRRIAIYSNPPFLATLTTMLKVGELSRISSRCDDLFRVVHSLREWFPALAQRWRHIGGVTAA